MMIPFVCLIFYHRWNNDVFEVALWRHPLIAHIAYLCEAVQLSNLTTLSSSLSNRVVNDQP